MSSHTYDPFIESLVFDTNSISGNSSPEEHTEELELWTNAQFTFDVTPGSAIEDKPIDTATTTPTTPNSTNLLLPMNIPQVPVTGTVDPSSELLKLLGLDNLIQQQLPDVPVTTHRNPPLILPKVEPSQAKNIASSAASPTSKQTNEKRTVNNKRPRVDEELTTQEREAVDEDKRRRNTAASARFRAKKKVRERAMEQSVKDMTEKSEKLEERVKSLEQEIKWLRTLLIEKNKKNDEAPPMTASPSSSSSS
ncbi:hypothetical protein BDA99DRAFT_561635 [Phascolomyces articulosus]|uniref:BZIP domain-containing protein n=1 Tax=Phascolomyces articulosus TaxID=60185 RepID=A0AAD5PDK7_9FUNG|nr:hypothetical protein BDA99DRAFT_561635 [Phascolomyces articulosus]